MAVGRIGAHIIDTSEDAWKVVGVDGYRYGDMVSVTDDKGNTHRGVVVNVWNWREDKPLVKPWVSFPGGRASFTVPVPTHRMVKL